MVVCGVEVGEWGEGGGGENVKFSFFKNEHVFQVHIVSFPNTILVFDNLLGVLCDRPYCQKPSFFHLGDKDKMNRALTKDKAKKKSFNIFK